MRLLSITVASLFSILALTGCAQESSGATKSRPKVGFITNCVADFWNIAIAGATKAAEEFDVHLKVSQPTSNGKVVEQKNFIEDMVAQDFDGIAITPLDPANQTPMFNEVAKKTALITHDSDAPDSDRLCFIGVDNYAAGRQCGELVREVTPEGGKIMLFIGGLDGDNARRRRQGVIDELFGRSNDPNRRDPVWGTLTSKDGKYTILGCLTDGFDRAVAKNNAVDTLTKHDDIACMVGLFEYNPPQILGALRKENMLKKVKVVGFDENRETLQGIRDGIVHGTVAQDPFNYGYLSVKLLAAIARGDRSMIPANKIIDVPAKKITAANVDAFEKELDALTGK